MPSIESRPSKATTGNNRGAIVAGRGMDQWSATEQPPVSGEPGSATQHQQTADEGDVVDAVAGWHQRRPWSARRDRQDRQGHPGRQDHPGHPGHQDHPGHRDRQDRRHGRSGHS